MSTLKFTPGPWTKWYDMDRTYHILGAHNGDGTPGVADVSGFAGFELSTIQANAKLITCSHEMITELMNTRSLLISVRDLFDSGIRHSPDIWVKPLTERIDNQQSIIDKATK